MSVKKQAWKMESGAVVVSENGVTKILTPPKGVSYSEKANRWYASVLSDKSKRGLPVWKSRSFGCQCHGVINAFEMAVEARESSISFLLDRRLLPRILRSYNIREHKGLYLVRDPIEKVQRAFTSVSHAKAFNDAVTEDWIDLHTFDTNLLIQLAMSNGEYVSFGNNKPKAYDGEKLIPIQVQ